MHMRPSRLFALACASLAASAAPTAEMRLLFDNGCVTGGTTRFTNAIAARDYIESVPKVAGKCENVEVIIEYIVDEVTRCASPQFVTVVGAPIGDLLPRLLADLNYSGDLILNEVFFFFTGDVHGDCRTGNIRGSGDATGKCGDLEARPYAMESHFFPKSVYFAPSDVGTGLKYDDLAVRADFGEHCSVRGEPVDAQFNFDIKLGLESTVGVKNVTIVFPDQPDCAPRGCDAIVGTKGVEVCLDNARAITNCKRAVYTRTYLHLGSSQCESTDLGKLHLNMDTILADDKALDFEDKHTVITSVSFGQKPINNMCTNTTLSFSNSCSDTRSLRSTLKEDPINLFTFTGKEVITADAVATNYTITTTCFPTVRYDGGEVTVKTELTIPHKYTASQIAPSQIAASASPRASGSFARLQVAGLLAVAASNLLLRAL